MGVRKKWLLLAVFILFIILSAQSAGAIATKTDSKYQNEAIANCSQLTVPQLSQARLYAPETQITTSQPGRISGGFQAPASMECPIRVVITLSVPSGTEITRGEDWGSGGAGLVQNSYTIQPGEIQSISANVYRSQPGEFTINGEITYWPVGLKNQSQEISGISLTFQSAGVGEGAANRTDFGVGLLLLLATTTIIFGTLLYYDSSIKIMIKEENVSLQKIIALIAAIFTILATLYSLLIS